MIFCEEKKEFVFSKEQERIDNELNEPANKRMARICLPAMNSVNKDLKFTTECPEDFPKDRLPTLDFVLWMVDGLLYHSYFEKAMRLQYTVMSRAAMSQHQKMAILGNELMRRLNNIHEEVLEQEIEEVIEHYLSQLKNSGYTRKQAKDVVVCGVVGWRRRQERRSKRGQKMYLEAGETLEQRTRDKLLEKTSWYKTNLKRKTEDAESQFQYTPPGKKRKRGMQAKPKTGKSGKVKAVMFVPFTKHSELATRIRENEEKMEQVLSTQEIVRNLKSTSKKS